jgi:hypothetical protein
MDFKTLHEDWKTLSPGPFTEPEDEAIYKEFLKIKEQGDVHHHHYAKGDNPDDKKKKEKDAKTKAKEGEAKADKPDGEGEAKPNGEGEAKPNGDEKKKLDPVGKEDGDIDNDGDQDKSDKYLAKKRKAIGKSIKSQKKTKTEKPLKLSGEKEKVKLHKGVEEASTYRDRNREDEKKKKKEGITPMSQKKKRWGSGGYGKGNEEVEIDEISSGLLVRAWQKSKVKADDAIKKRARGEHSIYKSAGEVIKRSKQGSKFYKAAIDKRLKDKKEGVEFDSKGKVKSLGFSFSDKVKKYNKKMQKSKDEMEKYKKEDVIDEKFAGWIAFHPTTHEKMEIRPKKGEIDSLYDAKQASIKHWKLPKSKHSLLAIKPAHEEVEVDEMSSERLAKAASKAEVQSRGWEKQGVSGGYGNRDPKKRAKRKAQSIKFAMASAKKYLKKEEIEEAPSNYEDEIKKFKAGGGKVKKLKPGKKFGSLFKQKGPKRPPRHEETEVEEGTGLQVKMALDDAGVKGNFKDGKVSVHKKHVKKAHKALKGNVYYKGKTPDVVGEDTLDEATKSQLRDFSQELASYARKHRSSIDKQYYEKIAQIAAAGKIPSAKDIDTDTEPRDVVLGMMAKSFPSGVMKGFKGISPALDKAGLYYARHGEEVEHKEEVNTGNNRLRSIEKEIDKLHGRTKHMKYLKGKDRNAMRDVSRKRDEVLKSRSIQGKFEEVELDELVAPGKKSASGYILYHKTFSDAMQHAVDHAKTKGVTVDPKEIDDKVATGPRKPSSGKTNRYSLGAGRKTVQIQVANLDNKAYELNMYIEGVQFDEDFKVRISNNPLVNKLYLINQAKAIAKENAGPDKEHKISAWEDLAKKMGFNRRDYEEFGEHQGMYESSIPQQKGDMATKTRLKLEKVLDNRKKFVEPKERAGEEGTDKLSDNYKEATPGQTQEGITGDPKANEKALAKNRAMAKKYGQVRQGIAPEKEVKEGNVIINDRDPYRVFEHMIHYLMGTSIKNIEDYSFYKIEETPDKLRLENKEGALATITLADVQSFYDDQDMGMEEFIEMMVGFGVKELTEKENSIIGDEGTPAIGKDKMGQGIYTTDPPKTFESHVDVYSKYIQSNEERQKKGFVVN